MADRYWNPSGAANWGTDTAVWSLTDGGTANQLHPTASDDVFFTGTNVNDCTITAAEVCKSITATGYTGTIAASALKTNSITLSGNVTTTGTLTLYGNSAINRLLIKSDTIGTPRTVSAGTIVTKWVDWRDITASGAANWNLTLQTTDSSGDCGGNTGITFTTAVTTDWQSGTTWSTATWSSRVPLPQDTATFLTAGTVTITQDMTRIGSVDFTGSANKTWTTSTACSCFGSINLTNLAALTASTQAYTFEGRVTGMPVGGWTLTSAGFTWAKVFGLANYNGTITLQDDLITTGAFSPQSGTIDANDKNVTLNNVSNAASGAKTITMGNGTWILTGTTATIWGFGSGANEALVTINAEGSTIKITDTSNTALTFDGATKTYNNLWWSRGASTASNTITDTNTFNDFKDDGSEAHSILTTAASTQTVTTFTVSGTDGKLITLESTTATGHYHFIASGGRINCDYLNIQHCVATPADTWYARNSTNNQAASEAGSGWTFLVGRFPVSTRNAVSARTTASTRNIVTSRNLVD